MHGEVNLDSDEDRHICPKNGKPCDHNKFEILGRAIKNAFIEGFESVTKSTCTSVIRWNRYDGTPETLPSDMEDVILFRCNGGSNNGGMGITFIQWDGQEAQYWRCGGACFDVNVGDLWAYLPEPPEGME